MKYNILDSNLPKLEKKIQRAINKGAPIVFIKGEKTFVEDPDFPTIKHSATECEVDGKYIINGWRFLATLEHKETGNVIRRVDSSISIPEYYRTCEPKCDHCKVSRYRKDTYIIYNEQDKKFMQVGKSCLKDFTNGLDANICAEIASVINSCEAAEGYESDDEYYSFIKNMYSEPVYFSSVSIVKLAISLIKDHGYDKDKSREILVDNIVGKADVEVKPCSTVLYNKVMEWINSLNDENDYYHSCKVIANSRLVEFRDFNFILSIINNYFKEANRVKTGKKSDWVGNEGDKIEINIASYRVLFENHYRINYYTYANSYTYEIVDRKGNFYILKTSKRLDLIDEERVNVTKITATVDSHTEYKDVKQTVIRRAKVIAYEPIKKESGTNNAQVAIDNFLQSIE